MSFGSLVQLGFNSAAGPKSVLGGVTSVWGNHWNGGIKLDETNVGFKFQGFPLSLGLVSYKETPKVQAGGCSLSEPRLASSQEHLRWLHVCKCLASMELLGLVWGGDSLTKIDAHTHMFFFLIRTTSWLVDSCFRDYTILHVYGTGLWTNRHLGSIKSYRTQCGFTLHCVGVDPLEGGTSSGSSSFTNMSLDMASPALPD